VNFFLFHFSKGTLYNSIGYVYNMNYKRLSDWNSGFHDWVIYRHPSEHNRQNGFLGGFIYGHKGNGKSMYCYKVMAKVYYTLNGYSTIDEEDDAYREALDNMFMDGDLFIDLIVKNRIKQKVTPIICLDDASRHFGTQMYKHNPSLYDAMAGEMAVARDVVTGFLINAPKRGMCAKFLRENDDYKGEALCVSGSKWVRKIRFYEFREYPDERKYKIQIPFQDKYSCFVPDKYFNWYLEKRRYYNIKQDILLADRFKPKNRDIIIALYDEDKSRIPREFHSFIKKWEKEKK